MFDYPTNAHERRHGPSGYGEYRNYKPWLRDEFIFRCVYCLEREVWYPDRGNSFTVDHMDAKSLHPKHTTSYLNLVYACGRCNSFKGTVRLLKPTEAAFAEHIAVDDSGEIAGLTDEGEILVKQLHLKETPATANRRDAILLHRIYEEMPNHPLVREKYMRHFGFPDDLPDLARLAPPGGNPSEGSEVKSYYQMRINGTLPETY